MKRLPFLLALLPTLMLTATAAPDVEGLARAEFARGLRMSAEKKKTVDAIDQAELNKRWRLKAKQSTAGEDAQLRTLRARLVQQQKPMDLCIQNLSSLEARQPGVLRKIGCRIDTGSKPGWWSSPIADVKAITNAVKRVPQKK